MNLVSPTEFKQNLEELKQEEAVYSGDDYIEVSDLVEKERKKVSNTGNVTLSNAKVASTTNTTKNRITEQFQGDRNANSSGFDSKNMDESLNNRTQDIQEYNSEPAKLESIQHNDNSKDDVNSSNAV